MIDGRLEQDRMLRWQEASQPIFKCRGILPIKAKPSTK